MPLCTREALFAYNRGAPPSLKRRAGRRPSRAARPALFIPFACLLALAAIAGATATTYLYDRDALLLSRLCAGVGVGFAALGLVGFVLASLLGMTPAALALAGAVVASPLLLLLRR